MFGIGSILNLNFIYFLFNPGTFINIFGEIFFLEVLNLLSKGYLWLEVTRGIKRIVHIYLKTWKFRQKTNFVKLKHVSFNERVSEGGGIVSLKIAKLFQKSWNLNNDPEDIFVWRVIMHAESFNSFVVFYDRIETFLF